jgi:predicted TIM-barrel fold metal-dependent hydrolase
VIVDIHGHVTSPELLQRFPMPPSLGDVDGMIEQKAAVGITTTIVGSPVGAGTMVPHPGLDNYAQPVDRLDAFHEWLAGTVRERRGRLHAYVYTNPYGGEELLGLAARWLQEDEFVGLIVNSSVRGEYLDDERADDFFAMAVERRAPVLLHPPAEPAGPVRPPSLGFVEHVARPCDVTAGTAAIILAGWLDKYPEMKLIAPGAGGALPLLGEKLDLAWLRPAGPGRSNAAAERRRTRLPSAALRDVYVDTATPSALAIAAALETFGPQRMLFGTDSPPLTVPLDAARATVDRLTLPAEARERVLSGNARTLFGLPADGAEARTDR